MRARFFELQPVGHKSPARTIYCDQFPVVFAHAENGTVDIAPEADEESACVLEEQDGNLILTRATAETFLNGAPIQQGGIAPGDRLKIGRTSYVVSYERFSSSALPEPVFRIPDAAS